MEFCFAVRHLEQNSGGWGGGSIWKPLKSPCPLVFNSENAAGHGSVGSCFDSLSLQ